MQDIELVDLIKKDPNICRDSYAQQTCPEVFGEEYCPTVSERQMNLQTADVFRTAPGTSGNISFISKQDL